MADFERAHEAPAVSVVICTRDRVSSLRRALAAIDAQDLRRMLYEVIVVDDGSRDESAQLAAEAGATVVRLEDHHGIAYARNVGVAQASAEIIAFTDDDCEPDRCWLSELLIGLGEGSVDAVAGRTLPAGVVGLHRTFLVRRNPLAPLPLEYLGDRGIVRRLGDYVLRMCAHGEALRDGCQLYFAPTCNLAVRRSVIECVGGFDLAFRGGEDEDLCRRAHAASDRFRLVYRPSAVVSHHFRSDVRSTLRRARGYGTSTMTLAAKDTTVSPIVFPVPVAALGALGAAVLTGKSGLVGASLALPFLGYPWWLVDAWRDRSPGVALLGVVQFAEELATMTGELDSVIERLAQRVRSRG